MKLKEIIDAARGLHPVALLLKNGTLVNVLSGEMYQTDIAIHDGRVVGLGEGYEGKEEVDCAGKWIAPGFIDGHMHVESTLVTVPEFARAAMPHGTVAAVFDPHEIANVHGIEGIRYILESRKGVPLNAFIMASSCVPATHMETAGAALEASDLAPLFNEEGVIGLAEVMNFPGVVYGDPGVLAKLEAAQRDGVVIDGHCPGLTGRDLNGYIAAGVGSDHECTRVEEAQEKLRKGMRLMIREASTAENLETLLPLVTPENARRCCFVTDDRHPADLLTEGHIDNAVRKAIGLGLDPMTAYRMASINTAEAFRLDDKGFGAIAPGWRADLLVLSDLKAVEIERVYVGGQLVAQAGEVVVELPHARSSLPPSVHVELDKLDFTIPAEGKRVKVITIIPGQIVTKRATDEVTIEGEAAVADPTRDLLKMAVVERHGKGGGTGLAFVRGFGLKDGAIASSVAHDSHNIVIAGANDADMRCAVEAIAAMNGGLVVVLNGEVLASLALPIAGLMSDRPLHEVRDAVDALHEAYHRLGGELSDPFMALSFLALPVIPTLKLTDKGLVDVELFQIVSLWELDPA
ncbi:MAG: adenine deaminase [Ardenticatenales bacterium]|nr:adenine deaminase [Ardenticatenales bacterium]